jgi:hypothetical protein
MHIVRRLVLSLFAVLSSAVVHATTYVVPPDDILVGKAHAIVTARALTSYAEDSKEHGIETITVLSIEDVLKGNLSPGTEVKVHVIGGVLEKRAKIVPGAPHFKDGERVLVFLSQSDSGEWGVTDFGLGVFGFATDDMGRDVLIRTATEISGWNLDGTVHHESRRDAERFLAFVRGVARHVPMRGDYTIEQRPLIGETIRDSHGRLRPTPMVVGTVTAYTLTAPPDQGGTEDDQGNRWNVFPGAVNWNKGNNETGGAPNGGTDAINAAFTSWNGDPSSNVNYVLATTNANSNGILEAPDGVNNIVFEKAIASPFQCNGGGVVGQGGIQTAVVDATNMVGGETFFKITEADVSMNQGLGACIGTNPGISVGDFNSAVTHEFGHTLGLRHADKNRTDSAACSTQPTYDCATSAIMTASVTLGLNAALQPWDQRAIGALYPGTPPPAAPTGVTATATSTTSVSITWISVAGATSYQVFRRIPGGAFTLIGTPVTNSFTDMTASANTAYLYRVRAVNSGGSSADSAYDLATTVIFTDDPLVAMTTVVKAVHLADLRTAVDAVRAQASLGPGAYTDAAMAGVVVKAIHIEELRSQLDAATGPLGLTTGGYTDGALTGVIIKAVHFQQLRDRVK